MTAARPRFSIVSAVYDVEPYLPEFIASIEAQRFDLGRIEVIAVDDGSTDGSLAILEAWAARRPDLVTVLTKENGGQGSARNLGLEHATGEWVTFTDPDDMLDRDFFAVADRFATAHPDVEILAGKPMLLLEATGRVSDTHPRRQQYVAGDRRVDLEREPNTFAGSATSLFKLERIRTLELRFETRITAQFEDGHMAARYIMGLPKPALGILRDARYVYRQRASGDSTLQQSLGHPGRYSDVLRFGYLDVLERAQARYGSIPEWVQHLVIYELSWYLSEDERIVSNIRMAPELVETFHDLLGRILGHLEPKVVRRHTVRPLKPVWVDIFSYAGRSSDWHSPEVVRTKTDQQSGLQRICYRYVGAVPREEFVVDGVAVRPAYEKSMSHEYYGRPLILERILWLPARGRLEVRLAGIPAKVRSGWPVRGKATRPRSSGEVVWLYRQLPKTDVAWAILRRAMRILAPIRRSVTRVIARFGPYRSAFRDAWVVMDRVDSAGDNGERLFEYLLAERPDINAWFVLEGGTPDWQRLSAAGTTRLVAYGSLRWRMLMLGCSWLLASDAVDAILRPPQMTRIDPDPTWRYAFLQHGVIKDDLSRWLNTKPIDLFVVSTRAELASIAADGTPYVFTDKETRKTGLPRFDRLLAKGREYAHDDRDVVIVAPTWRAYLALPDRAATGQGQVDDPFWESAYFRNWIALLRSPEIAEAAERRGLRIAFMPHPNMQPILEHMDLPSSVQPLTFADNDVQELYARCALLVTDYSSVAFDVALLSVPVVYFQFDYDEMMRGGHTARPGYFDYVRDGFGPVATDVTGAVAAIVSSIEAGPRPSDKYQARIDLTFEDRDGRACARVVAAVEELGRPYHASGEDVTRVSSTAHHMGRST